MTDSFNTIEDQLFNALSDAIETLTLEEQQAKEPLEQAFIEYLKPFEDDFDLKTVVQQNEARQKLMPEKKKMDEKVFVITRQASRKIDKLVKTFTEFQNAVQAEFKSDPTVIQAQAELDEATASEREAVQAKMKEIADQTDLKIKALQAEYEAKCEALGVAVEITEVKDPV
jgi:hypothetical protein